jgi:hypothetical protein
MLRGSKCLDVPDAEANNCVVGHQSIHDAKNASIISESDIEATFS